jgi:hypothetical protein
LIFPDISLSAQPSCIRCTLTAGGTARDGVAVAMIDLGDPPGDEIVVSLAGGSLTAFNADLLSAATSDDCFGLETPQISGLVSPGSESDFGSQLAVGDVGDDDLADIAATAPSASAVYVIRLDNSGPGGPGDTLVPPAGSADFGSSIAFANVDGEDGDEVIVGDRFASPEDTPNAGRAVIYTSSEGDGFELTAIIHDSTPETAQNFGRSIAAAEFVAGGDDTDLVVVGAQGEVFTYFRTLLQGTDPRQ